MEITQKQFNLLATKKDIDKLDKRMGKMDKRADKMDKRADKMDKRADKVDERFDNIDKRLDKLTLAVLDNKDSIEKSGRRIEEKLGAKIDGLITAVDNINKKYEDYKLERMSNQVAHDRMEEDIEKHDSKIGKLELKTV